MTEQESNVYRRGSPIKRLINQYVSGVAIELKDDGTSSSHPINETVARRALINEISRLLNSSDEDDKKMGIGAILEAAEKKTLSIHTNISSELRLQPEAMVEEKICPDCEEELDFTIIVHSVIKGCKNCGFTAVG